MVVSVASAAPLTSTINKTYMVDPGGSTPLALWEGAWIFGFALLVLSFIRFPYGAEGFISVLAWIPFGFALYTAFAIDRITSTGFTVDASGNPVLLETHTISSYPALAIILLVLLVFSMGNTYRIWLYQTQGTLTGNPAAD